MSDTERLNFLERHQATLQHHDYGTHIGPWYVMPHKYGTFTGKTLRQAIDAARKHVTACNRELSARGEAN